MRNYASSSVRKFDQANLSFPPVEIEQFNYSYIAAKAIGAMAKAGNSVGRCQDGSETLGYSKLLPSGIKELSYRAELELSHLRANADTRRLKREDLSINFAATQNTSCKVLNRELKVTGTLDVIAGLRKRCQKVVMKGAFECSIFQSLRYRVAWHGLYLTYQFDEEGLPLFERDEIVSEYPLPRSASPKELKGILEAAL
jgi:hypothetical protein